MRTSSWVAFSGTSLLAGSLPIDRDAAFAAVRRLADALGESVIDTAMSMVEITNQKMANAIRVVSVERGYDYRDCVLAYGGAGPLHGADLAATLGFTRVLIPPSPGILCAVGLLAARYQFDAVRTTLVPAERDSCSARSNTFCSPCSTRQAIGRSSRVCPPTAWYCNAPRSCGIGARATS